MSWTITYLAVHPTMPKDPVNVVAISNSLCDRLSLTICLTGFPQSQNVS